MAPTLKIYVTMFFVEGENSNMADRGTQLFNPVNAKLSQQRFCPAARMGSLRQFQQCPTTYKLVVSQPTLA